ncbi:OLC1v1037816C1 [Oldenlandia corymbosa var. corymbosa]|uniref:OLC1v1037816C1 n=1 Tax=Oldenlandia corymbosa var. corymbosa TaxID=529605 RepID=A0AAV1CZK9_OLDCO|nr:OLC1v1037816C1 [Oldenlandia corymbosa var. corymbosa]
MERKLSEAAIQGDVESLHQIMKEDPLILDKIIVSCVSETPLHTASILGHLNFVKKLLSLKPELASELDSSSCSPLHLAAAKGHVGVVEELLRADSEVGSVRNLEGRTALHVAVIKGRVKVVDELVRGKPELTRVLTDRGETVFHLCVKYNRLEVLKLLTESVQKQRELVNWRDSDGNTILHIAVIKKQLEMINHLLTIYELEVNALNKYSITALDILTQSPRDLRDLDIENALRKAGGLGAKDLHLITEDKMQSNILPHTTTTRRLSSKPNTSLKNPVVKHKHTDWLGRKRSALMVVASLLATVAFQAGLTPPGGVWQDDFVTDANGNSVLESHIAGTSVMAYKAPREYGLFMIFNTIAFLTSLSIILLLVSGLPLRRRRWMWLQMVTVWIAITFQVCTYFITLRHMSPDSGNVQNTLRKVTEISVLTWLSLMGVVFIGNVVRMNLWILRKYGYIKEKERVATAEEDDDDEM